MIKEKQFEDMCRVQAEKIWNRAHSYLIKNGIKYPMSEDYFYGFLAGYKLNSKRKKRKINE